MALSINGRMKVKTLKADFIEEFGLTLRIYDGRSFAEDHATLASIRKGESKGGEFAPKRNTKVGNLEDKIMEMFGIKTQVAGSDDSYLCDNDLTLAGALEADEKKMAKKVKKTEKNEQHENHEKFFEENENENESEEDITSVITISKIYFEEKDKKDVDTKEKLKYFLTSFLTTAFYEDKELRTTTGQLDFESWNENAPEVEITEESSLQEIEEDKLLFLFMDSDICANLTVHNVNNKCPLKIEVEKLGDLEIIQNIQQECADISYEVEKGGDTRSRSLQIIAKDDEVLYEGYWDWGRGCWKDNDNDDSIDDLLKPVLGIIDEACDEIS